MILHRPPTQQPLNTENERPGFSLTGFSLTFLIKELKDSVLAESCLPRRNVLFDKRSGLPKLDHGHTK